MFIVASCIDCVLGYISLLTFSMCLSSYVERLNNTVVNSNSLGFPRVTIVTHGPRGGNSPTKADRMCRGEGYVFEYRFPYKRV